MKLSSKMERCGLSPMRKFNPLAEEARARGIRIYHMNIGQPDVETPAPFFDALRSFAEPVVAYAPAPGIPVLLDAVRGYYRGIGVELARDDILPTFGGSEALQMTLAAIAPSRFYSQQLLRRVSSQYDIDSDDLETRIMAVIDYISGMTDVYALDIYQKINGISLPIV